jgi:hypothetical protein
MTNSQSDDPTIGNLNDADESNEAGKVHIFEEDSETDDSVVDPIIVEAQGENDDPVRILNVPSEDYAEELNKRAVDGSAMPNGDGEPFGSGSGDRGIFEGTTDDLYNEQEDAADQASDDLAAETEPDVDG